MRGGTLCMRIVPQSILTHVVSDHRLLCRTWAYTSDQDPVLAQSPVLILAIFAFSRPSGAPLVDNLIKTGHQPCQAATSKTRVGKHLHFLLQALQIHCTFRSV